MIRTSSVASPVKDSVELHYPRHGYQTAAVVANLPNYLQTFWAGLVCDSGRPGFRLEHPPNASSGRQMVRSAETNERTNGLITARETQPRDQSEDTSCMFLAAEPDWAAWVIPWNETFTAVWSPVLAWSWMTADFWFCSAYSGEKRALDTVIMYACIPNTRGMHKRSLRWNICVSLTDVPCSPADERWACGQLTPAWWSINLLRNLGGGFPKEFDRLFL